MKYEYIKDLTSDVAFKAYGSTFNELLENSAEALSGVMCNIDKIAKKRKIIVEAKGESNEDLLFNWLQQIIAEVEIEQMFFSKFNIVDINDFSLTAECYGEEISNEKQKTHVKALTNYLFKLEKKGKNFIATVSLDI
ncbi:MAG: archease [Candidatus Woesearchaeota archaeon]